MYSIVKHTIVYIPNASIAKCFIYATNLPSMNHFKNEIKA